MEKVGIKELRKRLSFYINNLPIEVTLKGKVVAVLLAPSGVHQAVHTEEKPRDNAMLEGSYQEKLARARAALASAVQEKVVEGAKCFKCGGGERVNSRWDNGEEFKVCDRCYGLRRK